MSPGSMSAVHCTRPTLRVDALAERARHHRLADAGHVLEQDVALGDHRDQREAHDVGLALDDVLDVVDQALELLLEALGVERRPGGSAQADGSPVGRGVGGPAQARAGVGRRRVGVAGRVIVLLLTGPGVGNGLSQIGRARVSEVPR